MSPAVKSIILRSSVITPDRLPGLAAWYSADYGVLSQVGGGTAFVPQKVVALGSAPAGLQFHTGTKTLCGWAKADSIATLGVIVSGGGAGSGIEIYHNTTGVVTFRNGAGRTVNSSTVAAGNWFFFYILSNATGAYVRINNGTQGSSTGARAATTTDFALGNYYITLNSGYTGTVDEVCAWDRELTEAEITWLYNSGAGRTYSEADTAIKTNLVSWWSMNAPASGDWQDQHGTNHLTPSVSRPTATEGVTFNAATDGQTVRRWLDRSGLSRNEDQAILANQAAFSGGAILGDGTNSSMSSTFATTVPQTVYMVVNQVTWTGNDVLIDVGTTGTRLSLNQNTSTPSIGIGGSSSLNSDLPVNTWGILTIITTAAGGSIRHNLGTPTTDSNTYVAGTILKLFANGAGSANANAAFKEIVVCAGVAHSDSIQNKAISYLARKWGIAI